MDTSLTQAKRNVERSKIEDFKKVVEEKMQEYQNTIQIFTDGSVIVNKTGISYQIPSLNVHENYRLPNNLTIFTVEGAAIVYALKRVSELISDDVTVFTDCLEVVNSLNEEGSETRSHVINLIRNQAYEIYRENGIKTNIVWIPGHSGISGNEAANDGAKEATSRDQIDVHISTSMKDAKTRIRKYIDNEWQRQWNLSTKGREYKRIEPTVSRKIKFCCINRKRETIQTRLRLGKCYMNEYLKIIGRHADGNCDRCMTPETIEHFILECSKNSDLLREIKDSCRTQKIPVDITSVLRNIETMNIITDYIVRIRLKI